jgi:hypothetical protein
MSENNFDSFNLPQASIPNATAVLVLGIISIPVICCYGLPGIICATIALVLAGKAKRTYDENPDLYQPSSFNNLKAGKICAIIGLVLGVIALIYYIVVITKMLNSGEYQEMFQQIMEQYGGK